MLTAFERFILETIQSNLSARLVIRAGGDMVSRLGPDFDVPITLLNDLEKDGMLDGGRDERGVVTWTVSDFGRTVLDQVAS